MRTRACSQAPGGALRIPRPTARQQSTPLSARTTTGAIVFSSSGAFGMGRLSLIALSREVEAGALRKATIVGAIFCASCSRPLPLNVLAQIGERRPNPGFLRPGPPRRASSLLAPRRPAGLSSRGRHKPSAATGRRPPNCLPLPRGCENLDFCPVGACLERDQQGLEFLKDKAYQIDFRDGINQNALTSIVLTTQQISENILCRLYKKHRPWPF